MKPLIIAPPASYSPDYKAPPLAPTVPSERAPSEPAGPAKVVAAVATGSLPVSSADVLVVADATADQAEYNQNAANYTGYSDATRAMYAKRAAVQRLCAQVLRRHAASMTERQPEENT